MPRGASVVDRGKAPEAERWMVLSEVERNPGRAPHTSSVRGENVLEPSLPLLSFISSTVEPQGRLNPVN